MQQQKVKKFILSTEQKLESTFKSALNMVPNGLMIIDHHARHIVFANKEMDTLVGGISGTCLKERICSFMFESNISDSLDSALIRDEL